MPPRFDKLLVLDLDETLVFATERPIDRAPDFRVGVYAVYERPGVRPFLGYCLDAFTVAVWSSSSEDYADAMVRALFDDPSRLAFVWGRGRCTWAQAHRAETGWMVAGDSYGGHWRKRLGKLTERGYAREKIIAVDDSPEKWRDSYGNVVTVSEYSGRADDEELAHLAVYLETLGPVANVRRIEKRGWRAEARARSPRGGS